MSGGAPAASSARTVLVQPCSAAACSGVVPLSASECSYSCSTMMRKKARGNAGSYMLGEQECLSGASSMRPRPRHGQRQLDREVLQCGYVKAHEQVTQQDSVALCAMHACMQYHLSLSAHHAYNARPIQLIVWHHHACVGLSGAKAEMLLKGIWPSLQARQREGAACCRGMPSTVLPSRACMQAGR